MIEKIKEHWPETLAGVGVLGAVLFYVFVVSAAAERRQELVDQAESHRSELEELAGQAGLPNEETIREVRKEAEQVKEIIQETETYFLSQRRQCHTRRFYYSPFAPQPSEIEERLTWLDEYGRRKSELAEASGGRPLFSLPSWSGSGLPTEQWITRAMVLYWFQKDMTDLFYNREPQVLKEYLEARYGGGTMDVSGMYDLVRTWDPDEPRETLIGLVRDDRLTIDQLRSIVKDLLFSAGGWRSSELLSKYKLRGEEGATVWDAVEQAITTTEQRQLLGELAGDEDWRTPDNDWRHLHDFAVDLRNVRFHADLEKLCERHGETEIVEYFKNPQTMQNQLRTAIDSDETAWSVDRLAGLVGILCAVHTRADYNTILKNHSTPLLQLSQFQLQQISTMDMPEEGMMMMDEGPGMMESEFEPGGMMPGAEGEEAAPRWEHPFAVTDNMYYALPFSMTVKIEFQKIPVLLRRLFQSDWCVQVKGVSFQRADWGTYRSAGQDTGAILPQNGEGMEPDEERLPGEMMEGEEGETEAALRAVPQRVVTLKLQCEGRSFYPLYRQTKGVGEGAGGADGPRP